MSQELTAPATALAAALADGTCSAVALLEAHIARIERLNPVLNALVTLDLDRARRDAESADARRRAGKALSAIDGLPMTIKDSISTAGLLTTSGAPFLADYVPDTDATAVARLRAAGAVIVGKSNLPTMAGDVQTDNPLFGRTNNPWDPARTPGGSSGGSAATIAVGMSALELGSDIAGSLRNPAHFCGVYAHKPTYNLIPTTGHIPPPPGIAAPADMGTLGPMARSVDDLKLLLGLLTTPASDETPLWRAQLAVPRHTQLRGQRIALWAEDPRMPVDAATRAMLEQVGDTLERAGAIVDRKARPSFDLTAVIDAYLTLLMPSLSAGLPDGLLAQMVAEAVHAPAAAAKYVGYAAAARTQSLAQHGAAKEIQARARAAWAQFFREFDALVCPVMPTAAFCHDQRGTIFARTFAFDGVEHPYCDQVAWCGVLASFGYLPATARPIRLSAAGLPMGVQIVGPEMGDMATIHLAGLLDDVFGGFVAPPMCKEAP